MSKQIYSRLPVYIFGVLSVLFLALIVAAFGVLKTYQDNLNQRSYDESGYAALQLRVHYESMMRALAVLEYEPSSLAVEDAVLQFDIFYERIKALPTRPLYDIFLDEESLGLHTEILQTLNGYLPHIDRAVGGQAYALSDMRKELSSMRSIVERLGHLPLQKASERRAEISESFRSLSDVFMWVIGGFVLCGMMFAGIIWRQLSQSAKRHVELEELTHNLQLARDEAESASNTKSDFLAHMSHELRTPMNSILGFAQLLEIQNPDEKQRQAVGQIIRSGNLLMHLIDQVLELNKIISGDVSVSIQSMSPAKTITTCLELMDSMAAARSITLGTLPSIHKVPDIETDPNRLQQILLNLMSNAIKYNRDGGEVTLDCAVLDSDEGWVRFSVADTGEGIPRGYHEKEMFQPFNRLGRETMNIEGTGIGLTITYELVRVLGGHIGYVSKPGEGSTFWVDLPVQQAETLVYVD